MPLTYPPFNTAYLPSQYQAVDKLLGHEYLKSAGYFQDDSDKSLPVVDQFGPHGSFRTSFSNWEKVTRNMARAKRPAILVSTGCFNPVHAGHLHMLEAAKTTVERQGWDVVGGFLSPSHDEYASTKAHHIDAAARCHLAGLATANSDWVAVDSWESMAIPFSVNFTDVLEYFGRVATQHFNTEVDIFYVFGSDNAGFMNAFISSGYAVCVHRTHDAETANVLDKIVSIVPQAAERIFISDDTHVASSTSFWEGTTSHMDPAVLACMKEKPDLVDFMLLRNDIYDSCRPYVDVNPCITSKYTQTVQRIITALERNTSVMVSVDSPRNQCDRLRNILSSKPDHVHCVNLDPWTRVEGTYNLNISRQFECGDVQLRSTKYVCRPGTFHQDELLHIPAGEYLLVDDDISTGKTMRYATELLTQRGKVVDIATLTDVQYCDTVDVRDFVIGAQHGGLVCERFGVQVRVPYLWPFVNVASRSVVEIAQCQTFSMEVLQANVELFKDTSLCISDADPAFVEFARSLGVADNMQLEEFCKQWIDMLSAATTK